MFTYEGTTVENGATVGVYAVRFYDGTATARYVNVDTELPSGGNYYDRPNNGVLWVALAEKAYAEANAAGYVKIRESGRRLVRRPRRRRPLLGDPGDHRQVSLQLRNDQLQQSRLRLGFGQDHRHRLGRQPGQQRDRETNHAYAVVGYNGSSSTRSPCITRGGLPPPRTMATKSTASSPPTRHSSPRTTTWSRSGPARRTCRWLTSKSPISPAADAPRITFGVAVPDAGTTRSIPGHFGIGKDVPRTETIRLVAHPAPKTVAVLETTGTERRRHTGTLAS